MSQKDVGEAFDILISELLTTLEEVRDAAAGASKAGEYEAAEQALEQARQIEDFIAAMRTKQKEWQRLLTKARGARRQRTGGKRLPRGVATPEEAYRMPILRALVALGGEARIGEVLGRVYDAMENQLKPEDLQPLRSDPNMPRWRNRAMWLRQRLVREGLLRNDSPRGIWAITDQGREYLNNQTG